jgi:phosphoglycolate phosphatase-like HAD superfamily hydrolase
MATASDKLIADLAQELRQARKSDLAVALDFDGVCKVFTEHKHQVMFTLLFLHVPEFQRMAFETLRNAYVHINFRSADYAGKERFLCVDALSRFLVGKGHNCDLPGLHKAVDSLKQQGLKISEKNLLAFAGADDVTRVIAWSREVNQRLAQLSEIGLTPGIQEHLFTPFKAKADFFVVSTATEDSLRQSLEANSIDFVQRYMGQETATKAEALLALAAGGYPLVVFFGDSLEDSRAAAHAVEHAPAGSAVLFAPVVPAEEEQSFAMGRRIIESAMAGKVDEARKLSTEQAERFKGKEVGSRAVSPLDIRA